jgi:hypothetical protein
VVHFKVQARAKQALRIITCEISFLCELFSLFCLALVNLLLGFSGKYCLFFVPFGLLLLGFDSGIFTFSRSSSSTSILFRVVLLLIFWLSEKYLFSISLIVVFSSSNSYGCGCGCGCDGCRCDYWSLLNEISEMGYTGLFVSLLWL